MYVYVCKWDEWRRVEGIILCMGKGGRDAGVGRACVACCAVLGAVPWLQHKAVSETTQ
jgi:hypothetical protein